MTDAVLTLKDEEVNTPIIRDTNYLAPKMSDYLGINQNRKIMATRHSPRFLLKLKKKRNLAIQKQLGC